MNLRSLSRRAAPGPPDRFAGRSVDVIGSWTPNELSRLTGRLQAGGLACTRVSQGQEDRVVLRVQLADAADRCALDELISGAGGRILALPR